MEKRKRLKKKLCAVDGTIQCVDVYVTLEGRTEQQIEKKWKEIQIISAQMLREGRRDELLVDLGKSPRGVRNSKPSRDDQLTLSSLWDLFDATHEKHGSPAERASKRTNMRLHILPVLGGRVCDDLARKDVLEFRNGLVRKGLAQKTANNVLTTLRVALTWGVDSELIRHNAASTVTNLPLDKVESSNWWSPSESDVALTYIRLNLPREVRLLFDLLFRAAPRYGEAAGLQCGDLDPDAGVLHIRRAVSLAREGEEEVVRPPKRGSGGTVFIGKAFAKELAELTKGRAPTDLLFTGPRGGRIAKTTLRRWLDKACEGAGVRRISLHGLRHSCGTWAASKGMSQAQIARVLRHSEIRTAERYTHTVEAVKLGQQLWGDD